jgi:hypothetical protein
VGSVRHSKCPCCGADADGKVRVVLHLNLLCCGEHMLRAPHRVASLAKGLLAVGGVGLPPRRAMNIVQCGNIPLLYVYVSKLRTLIKPWGKCVSYTGGRYRIEDIPNA